MKLLMKLKYGVPLCLLFSLISFTAPLRANDVATKEKRGEITISGLIDETIDAGLLIITLATDSYQTINWPYDATQIPVPIINASFSISLDIPERFCYVKFQLVQSDENRRSVVSPLLAHSGLFFLLEKGSDIKMNIKTDTVSFSGDGADLFQCQYEAFELREQTLLTNKEAMRQFEHALEESMVAGKDTKAMYAYLMNRFEQEHRIQDAQIKVLDGYQNRISVLAAAILDTEYRSNCLNSILRHLHFYIGPSKYSSTPGAQRDVVQFFLDSIWFSDNIEACEISKLLSPSYLRTVYLKELSAYSLPIKANQSALNSTAIFEAVIRKIGTTYDEVTAEGLLTVAFATQVLNGDIPDELFDYASGFIGSQTNRQRMIALRNVGKIGTKGFDFTLPDSTGQQVSFADFSDKVVILDFWYTGCGGCVGLKKKITPVVSRFIDNNDVVFLTISIDKDQSTWKKSLRSGVYTHRGSVDLFTAGKGKDAAVINHYRIGAYPTMIVFDRQGKIRAFNPPEIGSEMGNSRLIKLIDSLL